MPPERLFVRLERTGGLGLEWPGVRDGLVAWSREGLTIYIKRDRKKLGRRKVAYTKVAHNLWDGEMVRPAVVANLGREDQIDPERLEGMRAMAQALYDVRIKFGDTPEQAVAAVRAHFGTVREELQILSNRAFGMRLILEPIWEELGIGEALRGYQAVHKVKFPLERVVFGMVLNRLVDPKSKRACNDWLQDLAYFPEAQGWQVQHFYRAMDVLHEHWDALERALHEKLWERTSPAARAATLVDTTSLYFESTRSDEELATLLAAHEAAAEGSGKPPAAPVPQVVNDPPFRMRGHNKDGHGNDPQVVIASIVTPDGLILGHGVYAGNTNDQAIGTDLIKRLPPTVETVRIWVSDAGMVDKQDLATLDRGGWHRITADSARKSRFAREHVLPLTGRYKQHPDKPKFSYRQLHVPAQDGPSGRDEKWILVRNAVERERQLEKIARHKEGVLETLAKQRGSDPHGKSACAAATNPSLRKYVAPSPSVPGQFVFDEAAYRQEQQLAGTHLYRSTLASWEPHEIHDAYQLLQRVEQNHREFKTPLRLRPAYHRTEDRIKAHVMINVLAINCLRVLEQKTGQSAEDLRKLTAFVTASEIRQGSRTWWQLSELQKPFVQLLKKLGMTAPARTWEDWREVVPSERIGAKQGPTLRQKVPSK